MKFDDDAEAWLDVNLHLITIVEIVINNMLDRLKRASTPTKILIALHFSNFVFIFSVKKVLNPLMVQESVTKTS